MGRARKKDGGLQSIATYRNAKEMVAKNEITVETNNNENERLRKIKIPQGWLYILETYYKAGPQIGDNSRPIVSTAMTFVPDHNLLS